MGKKLANKVAIITGASSGIGQATAVLFAKEGSKVVVVDRDSEKGSETVNRIKENNGDATLIFSDVSKDSDVQDMVKKTVDQHGRLDILVNNAGIFKEGDAVKATEAGWQDVRQLI